MIHGIGHFLRTESAAVFRGLIKPSGRTTRTGFVFCIFACTFIGQLFAWSIESFVIDEFRHTETLSLQLTGFLLVVPTIRRLHDIGRSGWLAVIVPLSMGLKAYGWYQYETQQALAPGVGYPLSLVDFAFVLVFLAIILWPPKEGPNRYGPEPYSRVRRAAA